MRRIIHTAYLRALSLAALSTAWAAPLLSQQSAPSPKPIEQKFIHKYGMTMPPQEWRARGSDGEVITTFSDGVVLRRQYKNGQLHGVSQYTFAHSDIAAKKELYEDGRLVRESYFFRSGSPNWEKITHSNGNEELLSWFEGGMPKSEELWSSGKLLYGRYYNMANELESAVDEGKGSRMRRDHLGQIEAQDLFDEGQMVRSATYHPNGSPKEVISLHNGLQEGICSYYLADGEPQREEEWAAGRQHGLTHEYRDGELVAAVNYQKGAKQGIEERFQDGKVVEAISWRNGQRHGPSLRMVGPKKLEEWHFEDRPVSKEQFEAMSYYTPAR